MDPISHLSSMTSAISDDKSNLYCPKRKDVLECHICFEPPMDPVATSCGHVFCWPCVYKWLEGRPKPSCPVCRLDLRTDRNIIPLYGGGGRVGPSNGNKASTVESPVALVTTIPPPPRNPLLVSKLMIEHCAALLTRVRNLETERANLECERRDLEHMNADLRCQIEEKDHRIFELERHRMMPGVHDLQQRNFVLVREVQHNQTMESWHIERENQMGEEIAGAVRWNN